MFQHPLKQQTKPVFIILILALLLIISQTPSTSAQSSRAVLPPGFDMDFIAGTLKLPVDMTFLPDGDIFVIEKGQGTSGNATAYIKWVNNGTLQEQPIYALQTTIRYDSGLLGIIADPNFAENKLFYVWYASEVIGENATLRLVQLTFDEATKQATNPQLLLFDLPWGPVHIGFSLAFDEDGHLYIGIGDLEEETNVQQLNTWNGKILRIKPNQAGGYTIPADNPYIGRANALPEIFAYGVRNPFRMSYRQSDNTIYFGDVGSAKWEEVNQLESSLNYGWPIREGICPQGEALPCEPAGPEFTDPILTYSHEGPKDQSGAITGLDFYEGTTFPAQYQDALFFSDFNRSFIAYSTLNSDINHFASNADGIVDIEYFNEALYILDLYKGEISRIHYSDSGNAIPVATLEPSVSQGAAPLSVVLSAADSYDPDGIQLTYNWDFGDGTPSMLTDDPLINHTYTADGTYTATVRVTDDKGGTGIATATITVYSGELPQIKLTILNEPTRTLYHGGDQLQYEAIRSNLAGLDPTEPFKWQINFHHNTHSHPIAAGQVTQKDTFNVPTENHDGAWSLWYNFILTMKTDTGQEIIVSREIFPQHVDITFDTQDGTAGILLNNIQRYTPYTLKAITNQEHTLTAADTMVNLTSVNTFDYWQWDSNNNGTIDDSDEITTTHTITIHAPTTNITYRTYYQYLRDAINAYLPLGQKE